MNVNPKDYDGRLRDMFDIELSTMLWWAEQTEEVRAQAFDFDHNVPLETALLELNRFVDAVPENGRKVWSKGSTYDLVVLRSAYSAMDLTPAWHFREERCFRTKLAEYMDMGYVCPDPLVEGEKHNALYDAKYQARQLATIREFERAIHEQS